jgi:hypothetical protein
MTKQIENGVPKLLAANVGHVELQGIVVREESNHLVMLQGQSW